MTWHLDDPVEWALGRTGKHRGTIVAFCDTKVRVRTEDGDRPFHGGIVTVPWADLRRPSKRRKAKNEGA